jgi:hypothetical protein
MSVDEAGLACCCVCGANDDDEDEEEDVALLDDASAGTIPAVETVDVADIALVEA